MSTFELTLDETTRSQFAGAAAPNGQSLLSVGAALELALAAVHETRVDGRFELGELTVFGPVALDAIAVLRCAVTADRVEVRYVRIDAARGLHAEQPLLRARVRERSACDAGPGFDREAGASTRALDVEPRADAADYLLDPRLLDAGLVLLTSGGAVVAIDTLRVVGRPDAVQRVRVRSTGAEDATLEALDGAADVVWCLSGVRTVSGSTLFALRVEVLAFHMARLLPTLISDRALDPAADLLHQGLTSLELLRLASAVRAEFGCEIALSRVARDARLHAIAEACVDAPVWTRLDAPVDVEGPATTASYAQQQLWYLERLGDLGPTYHEGLALDVQGALDTVALARAFQIVVERHAALRACFADGPTGVIRAVTQAPIHLEIRAAPHEALHSDALGLAREWVSAPFDLERGPLLRAVAWVGERRSLIVLAAHHLIVDGWSLGRVFLPELQRAYAALLLEQKPVFEPATDFARFVAWERAHVAQWTSDDAARAFFQQSLSDMPTELDLPLDAPRPPRASYAGASLERSLDAQTVRRVQALSASAGVTPFAVYFAAFALLLGTYARCSRLIVGAIGANRGRREHESMVGMLASLVPVGVELEPDATLATFVRSVAGRVLAALDHQSVPLSQVVAALGVPRVAGVSPLVQVAFALEDSLPDIELGAAHVSACTVPTDTAKLDLLASLYTDERGGRLRLEYRRDLFEHATIAAMADTWAHMLDAMLARPDARLSEFELVSPGMAQREGEELSGTASPVDGPWLHEAIEAWATRTPHALAVTGLDGGGALTYAQLCANADRVAAFLEQRGVTLGSRVGVRMARTPELVAALLGILKVGAAYVPLDRALPRARVLHIIEDAQLACVLCDTEEPEELPGMVRGLSAALAAPATSRAPCAVPGDAVAYILYTSGSTGLPKGVMVEHRNLAAFFAALQTQFGTVTTERWLASIALSFDFSVADLWWPLTRGLEVTLHPGWGSGVEAPADAAITHLICTPTVLALLLDQAAGCAFLAGLKELWVGGEALPPELVRRVRRVSETRIRDVYGPTEATVFCTTHEVQGSPALIPIGRPLSNVALRVVDPHARSVPRGAPGELLIGGAFVARGYVARPAGGSPFFETSDATGATQRWYRSGDLVRVRASGELEFLGRADRQIKLRGQRIELAEIEAVLRSMHDVTDCAVELMQIGGTPRLVAFARMRSDVDTRGLRDGLEQRLPLAWVPTHIVAVDDLPRTVSGKLDRKALLSLLPDEASVPTAPAAEGSELERGVAELMARVVGRASVGLDADFFEVGGDSLSALRLVNGIYEQLGHHLALRTVVAERTPRRIARSFIAADIAADTAPTSALHAQQPVRCRILPAAELLHAKHAAYALATRPEDPRAQRLVHAAGGTPAGTPQVLLRTEWGEVAVRVLSCSDAELFGQPERYLPLVREEIVAAVAAGARAVALTGLLAVATDYGHKVRDAAAPGVVSTGHAATCAAVVTSVRSVLAATGRDLADECVAVLGVGSIGAGAARLMAQCLAAPRELVLCDVPAREARVVELARELQALLPSTRLRTEFNVQGQASALYDASVIVGATSRPDVLDVERLRPGSLVIDDSFPHCVSVAAAVSRMRDRRDVLICEAGAVRAPREVVCGLAEELELGVDELRAADAFFGTDAREIMACTLSARLMLLEQSLSATLGEPTNSECLAYLRAFDALGIHAAPLRLSGVALDDAWIDEVARRYGRRTHGA